MLYKGNIHKDVEKEKTLTTYQLKRARFEIDRDTLGMDELTKENDEVR